MIQMNDVRTMLKTVCHNIQLIFSDTDIHVNSYYHVNFDKKSDTVRDMDMDIQLSFNVPEENLIDIERRLAELKPILESLNNSNSNRR